MGRLPELDVLDQLPVALARSRLKVTVATSIVKPLRFHKTFGKQTITFTRSIAGFGTTKAHMAFYYLNKRTFQTTPIFPPTSSRLCMVLSSSCVSCNSTSGLLSVNGLAPALGLTVSMPVATARSDL